MSEFDAIRPYHDAEVRPTLDALLGNSEFLDTIACLKLPKFTQPLARCFRPYVRRKLREELSGVHSVGDFQTKLEGYLKQVLHDTVTDLTVSGLDNLQADRAHLFISNHRDIAMDPALVNWALYHARFSTLRIAIGDNLLTKDFASHLMRLNKSFIVQRSLSAPREKLKAAKQLSKYIHHSLCEDNENIWIAQREGRAKDGDDKTNPAIIRMLSLNKPKSVALDDYFSELNIVPVSISYEFDPCGFDKARELHAMATEGQYVKGEQEDVQSIAKGITGFKGRVHVAFGPALNQTAVLQGLENVDPLVEALDQHIEANFCLSPNHCFAYEKLENQSPNVILGQKGVAFTEEDWTEERKAFDEYLDECPKACLPVLLKGYAKPVYNRLAAQG